MSRTIGGAEYVGTREPRPTSTNYTAIAMYETLPSVIDLVSGADDYLQAFKDANFQKSTSFHRLLQDVFFFEMAGIERQMEFETAVKHTNSAFPKQINGRPLFDRWDECQKHIKQALALAE